MSKYDSDSEDFIMTKGVISKLKLNVTKEKKDGGTWKCHVLVLETGEDEEVKFLINLKSKAAEFVAKLKEGQNVTVKQKDDKFKSVIAVFNNDFKKKDSSKVSSQSREYDPTGPIQGNILTNAVTVASNSNAPFSSESIIEAAKEILKAKEVIDKLVIQALKSKPGEDDEDVNESDEESNEDSDVEERTTKNSKKSPY